MKKLSTKNSLRRRIDSAWRHLVVIADVLFFTTLLVSLVDYLLWGNLLHFSEKEEVVVTAGPIALLVLGYGITAGLVFNSVWEKYRNVMKSVMRGNRYEFLVYRDERIPVMLYLLLGIFSLMLLTLIGMLHFEHHTSWLVCETCVAFVTSFFWILTVKIDNPCTSSWLRERIDPEWLTADVDEEFFGKLHH